MTTMAGVVKEHLLLCLFVLRHIHVPISASFALKLIMLNETDSGR